MQWLDVKLIVITHIPITKCIIPDIRGNEGTGEIRWGFITAARKYFLNDRSLENKKVINGMIKSDELVYFLD